MQTTKRARVSVGVVALAALGALVQAAPLAAQLPNASAATLGTAGNNTATVRGFAAIATNPAGLGMPGSGFSLAIAPVQLSSGLDPIGLKDLKDAGGKLMSDALKQSWLDRVTNAGGQSGSLAAGVSVFSLSAWRLGFQVSTIASADLNLAPSIMELALYGNAGRTGTPANLTLSGSAAHAFVVTTAGLSYGMPLHLPLGTAAVGVTLKYSVGQVLALARDQGGSVQSNPVKVNVDFPMITPNDSTFQFNNGTGVGLDVGFQMKRGPLALGGAITNLFNTFSWTTDNLAYRAGTAVLEQGTDSTNFDKQPYSAAPTMLKSAVNDMKFKPGVSVGGAYDVMPDLTVSADLRAHASGGMSIEPKMHLGAGAEYRGLKILYLRAGMAVITNGYEYGGGASLVLGPVNISAAGAMEGGGVGQVGLAQFTLSFGGR